jgi:cytochrome b6-f complex iron-sulfur subunit
MTDPETEKAPDAGKEVARPPAPPKKTKPAAGAAAKADDPEYLRSKQRRKFIWTAVWSFVAIHLLMAARFFFPRALFEPKTMFTVGRMDDFGLGVDTRFQQAYRIWVVRKPDRVFVIFARCTHLGCTPDWKESERKFKCPCHGSGYDTDGVNFEGPAPRPMDRAQVELDATGQIVVNTGKLFKCERGGRCEFDDPGAYIVT